MKRRGWQAKLTKRELQHVADTTDGGLLREFKRNRESHLRDVAKGLDDPCFECRIIVRKLGLKKPPTEPERMLRRLAEKVKRANEIQHSGGRVSAEDWAELYQLVNEAGDVLSRADV